MIFGRNSYPLWIPKTQRPHQRLRATGRLRWLEAILVRSMRGWPTRRRVRAAESSPEGTPRSPGTRAAWGEVRPPRRVRAEAGRPPSALSVLEVLLGEAQTALVELPPWKESRRPGRAQEESRRSRAAMLGRFGSRAAAREARVL